MPTATYEKLLKETVPQIIEIEKQYREIGDRFGELVGKGRARTQNKTKLMRLLALLIEDYDRRHALPPDNATSDERLRFLMEHSGKTPADLLPIFGQQPRERDPERQAEDQRETSPQTRETIPCPARAVHVEPAARAKSHSRSTEKNFSRTPLSSQG